MSININKNFPNTYNEKEVMRMKKLICLVLIFILVPVPMRAKAIEVSAKYACVMEAVTGEVVWEKNSHETYAMASTTKIMTALLAIEAGTLNDTVTVSQKASLQEGSSIYLKAGDKINMRDLLYGLMLNSGNDAAVAVAEHVSGSTEAFAEKMTARAHEIGANDTAFKNPNGLDEEGHYTTAYDLALITRAALKNPAFSEIVASKSKKATLLENGTDLYFTNHNKMLKLYEGADGVKTGYTKATGRCLVSSATRNGIRMIAVTLNAPNDWKDHAAMLDFAFDGYEMQTVVQSGAALKQINTPNGVVEISAQEEVCYPVQKGKSASCEVVLHIPKFIQPPVARGEKIGEAEVLVAGREVKRFDLISSSEILVPVENKKSIGSCFEKIFKNLLLTGEKKDIIDPK
jgi:D-alanyl-D-alanine carboxypeptidase (penicillin-binding protein 5/6)